MLEDSDLIFIPQEARGQPIAKFPISVRLAHVLQSKGIQSIGELHGLLFQDWPHDETVGRKPFKNLVRLCAQCR
jgi:hypothetical protein